MSDNTELISQFAELTQSPTSVAEVLLSRNNWDLQVSVIRTQLLFEYLILTDPYSIRTPLRIFITAALKRLKPQHLKDQDHRHQSIVRQHLLAYQQQALTSQKLKLSKSLSTQKAKTTMTNKTFSPEVVEDQVSKLKTLQIPKI